MIHQAHKSEIRLEHPVDVSKAAQALAQALHCQTWYVVCHREHQLIIHLSVGEQDRYALSFECSEPVEKAIYHGSRSSRLAIIPLEGQADLDGAELEEVRRALGVQRPV